MLKSEQITEQISALEAERKIAELEEEKVRTALYERKSELFETFAPLAGFVCISRIGNSPLVRIFKRLEEFPEGVLEGKINGLVNPLQAVGIVVQIRRGDPEQRFVIPAEKGAESGVWITCRKANLSMDPLQTGFLVNMQRFIDAARTSAPTAQPSSPAIPTITGNGTTVSGTYTP